MTDVTKILNMLDDVSSLAAKLKHLSASDWAKVDSLCDKIREIVAYHVG